MKNISFLLLVVLFASCKGDMPAAEFEPNDIDAYVADKLDDSQIYDVSQSLRFSRDNETYEVVQYMQNDTVVLFLETHITQEEQIIRQFFYRGGILVFVDESIGSNVAEIPFTQRQTYFEGDKIVKSQQRSTEYEMDLKNLEFEKTEVALSDFDFQKPVNAMDQKGEFEMTFEEFIVVDQTYLILENPESEFDVALFVNSAHPLLDKLFAVPADYVGKTIFVTHQFISMNGVERMLFVDAFFVKDEEIAPAN